MAGSASSTSLEVARQAGSSGAKSVNWPLWYVLPIAPYQRRKTLMEEIVPGKVRLAAGVGVKKRTVRRPTCGSVLRVL